MVVLCVLGLGGAACLVHRSCKHTPALKDVLAVTSDLQRLPPQELGDTWRGVGVGQRGQVKQC